MAAGIGARTQHMRIGISLLLLPFYQPHRLAEDLGPELRELAEVGAVDADG